MTRLPRALAMTVLILGGLVFLASLLLFLAWPTLLSGSACQLSIQSIDVDPDGWIKIRGSAVVAYGTNVFGVAPIPKDGVTCVDRTSWESCPPSILRWPRPADLDHWAFRPGRPPVTADGKLDLASMRGGLMLKPGTYRLRPGEKLLYFRGKESTGKAIEGTIEVQFTQ